MFFDFLFSSLIIILVVSLYFLFRTRQKLIKKNGLEATLAESSQKIEMIIDYNKRIIDNVPVSILTMDKKGKILSANPYVAELSGHDSDEKIGKNIFDFRIVKENNLKDKFSKLLFKGQAFDQKNCVYKPLQKDEVKYLNIIAVPLKNKKGEIEGAVSMAINNTQAIESELDIKQKAEQLYLLNQITLAINSILDLKEVLWVILRNAAKLTSAYQADIYLLENNELVLKEIYSLKYYYDVSRQEFLRKVKIGEDIIGHVVETKKPYLCNNVNKDEYYNLENNSLEIKSQLAIPIFSQKSEHEIKGVIRVSSDRVNHFTKADEEILITLANNASVAIANSELYHKVNELKKFSDDIIDSSSLAIVVTDIEGKIVRYNNSAQNIMSKLNVNKGDLFFVENYFNIKEIINRIRKNKQSFSLDKLLFANNGETEFYNIKIDPILDVEDELSNVIITIEDVTKKVKLFRISTPLLN